MTHRWLSLALGLVLLVITTSGAAVVYAPEWTTWTNHSAFQVGHTADPVPVSRAIAVVAAAHPGFDPATVDVYHGVDEVLSADADAHPGFWGVDPSSGAITGYVNPDRGVMALLVQVHECFFSCDGYPADLGFLAHPMPTLGMHWLSDVTVAGFVIGVAGLLLLFLAVSGIWLWWPTFRRLRQGFRVRMHKGRYARDYDLHQVVGMAAVPFLLVWGLTGAGFEFHWVSTAWYAVTGGQQVADSSFTSTKAPAGTPDIGLDAAAAASRAEAGPSATLTYASKPAAGDETAYYDFWYSRGFDPYRYGAYPGQYEVQVDRHDASRVAVDDYGTASTLSNQVLDNLGPGTLHFGQSVNPWWRLPWFVVGLTPLLLAATGVSTWLAKRGTRKRRQRARSLAAAISP